MMRAFLREDSGQDLVEYGLLSALVGIAAILVWQQLVDTVGQTYGLADARVQDMSSCTPDPGVVEC
jgi:Flp pilus assembly pilin Flp